MDFSCSFKVDEVRNKTVKINSFRQYQLETINATLAGHDCILVMPAGSGKSLYYQLPAVLSDGKNNCFLFPLKLKCLGITIVISPLISLVDDQVYALRNLNIDARSLNTSTSASEQSEIMRILDGTDSKLKILYLTAGMA